MIMSSEPADETADIPVAEVVQETEPEDSVAEVVEALDPEDSEAALFRLGGDYDKSEELPGESVVKDDR